MAVTRLQEEGKGLGTKEAKTMGTVAEMLIDL